MCDFSLQNAKSRPAVVADRLITKNFRWGTFGFTSIEDAEKEGAQCTAVCLLPGTEIVFDADVKVRSGYAESHPQQRVARFRQINKDKPCTHHDALEFADGEFILLTYLDDGQTATVLQLPAAPKTEAEAQEQKRLEVVG